MALLYTRLLRGRAKIGSESKLLHLEEILKWENTINIWEKSFTYCWFTNASEVAYFFKRQK